MIKKLICPHCDKKTEHCIVQGKKHKDIKICKECCKKND